jgi:RimJ/RimL family protein N-acetyltransferase
MNVAEAAQALDLKTRRLVLAPVKAAHARALHRLVNDWDVAKMLAVIPWPVPLEAVEDFAAGQERSEGDEDAFAILLEGKPIGVCGIKRPGTSEPPRAMPRLGYWLGRQYWGQGYMTEAVEALVGHAFERFPQAEVIGAGVFEDNPASRRVQEKLGFEPAGGYPLHCVARDAEVYVLDMNLTRERWAAVAGRA